MPARKVVVPQQEVQSGGPGILVTCRFESAELLLINVRAGVEAAQRLPVPARADVQDGVNHRRRLSVAVQGEQHERAKFVEHGIVRHLGNSLIRELQGCVVLAFEKGATGLVEFTDAFRRNARRQGCRRRRLLYRHVHRGRLLYGHVHRGRLLHRHDRLGHDRLGIVGGHALHVIGVVVVGIAEQVPQVVGAPPGKAGHSCNRVVVPQVIPLPPVSGRITRVPVAIPAVMIVKPGLPIFAGVVAMVLPVFADLIAMVLPVLADVIAILLPVVASLLPVFLAVAAVLLAIFLPVIARLLPVITFLVAVLLPIVARLLPVAPVFLAALLPIAAVVLPVLTNVLPIGPAFTESIVERITPVLDGGIGGPLAGSRPAVLQTRQRSSRAIAEAVGEARTDRGPGGPCTEGRQGRRDAGSATGASPSADVGSRGRQGRDAWAAGDARPPDVRSATRSRSTDIGSASANARAADIG